MKKPLLIISLLAAIVYACNRGDKAMNKLLNTGKLRTQSFVIDITRDTSLTTQKGALIRIPRGAIAADDNIVKLEVKEAYSIHDILKAGLTTQSDGRPLSSGGMIYINAVSNNNASITQKIFVATPTPYLEKNMQLFKGEVQGDSTINWTDPKPMTENPQITELENGKQLFQDNCASCHAIDKDLTGPALGGVMARVLPVVGDTAHLYEFIRNPVKVMKNESYFQCLKNKFGGAVMTAFPHLTNEALDAIHGYIENEYKRINPHYDINIAACYDSCRLYNEVAGQWKQIKATLEKETVDLVKEKKDPSPDTTGTPDKVLPDNQQSLYYQFTIDAFGWYNIDMLLRENIEVISSELRVHIKQTDEDKFNLYLVIPSLKVFESGGPLEDITGSYGFYTIDGKIPLPQNRNAYILAIGEQNDKIIFGKQEFITREKQVISLQLTTISKEAFEQQIDALQLGDLSIKANDTKNAESLRKSIRELERAEQLKPTNCDCDCFTSALAPAIPAEGEYTPSVDANK